MLDDPFRNLEGTQFLFGDLFGVTAQNQMNLVRDGVDLL